MANKVIYYSDPLHDDFAQNTIQTCKVDETFPFAPQSFLWRIASNLVYYGVAIPIVFLICKLYLGVRFENHKALSKLRKSGYFLYGNHTRALDAFLPAVSAWPKRAYIVANPDAVSIPGLKTLVRLIGCLPIPTEAKALPLFLDAITTRCQEKSCIGIYPEAHIWPFYTGVRPFPTTSFRYPVKENVPAVAMAVTYRKRKGLFFWAKRPGMTLTFSQPFYPDQTVSLRQARQALRDQVYNFMCDTAARPDNVVYIRYEKRAEQKPFDSQLHAMQTNSN
ncbi:MAG: 1-acyl-sn-glycerol-3-phosphate acyltransferase [Oscillospiraceae bacterium]|nr:1-acyl-sn-glycerol-3-phosphate acyltransferase [Oscillospiraceae bacterium]